MRFALISDIHGNLNALEAVLEDIEAKGGADQLVCLGDITAVGPQPKESLDKVRELDCPIIMGNHDEWLLTMDDELLIPEAAKVDKVLAEIVKDIDTWDRDQLTKEDLEFVKTFKNWWRVDLSDEIDLLCFHGSPRSHTDMLVSTSSDEELNEMFERKRAAVMIGGHTHLQMLRRWQHMLIINPGSVGAPFYHNFRGEIRNPWWAEYAILEFREGNFSIDLRRVSYDVDKMLKIVHDSGMPHTDWWINARD